MTQSMTGFARLNEETPIGAITLELKSVNSRYLDLHFKLSESLKPFENELRQILSRQLARGKVECFIRFVPNVGASLNVNVPMIEEVLQSSASLVDKYQLSKPSLGDLLSLPGAFIDKPVDNEVLWQHVLALLNQGISGLIAQREKEGAHLESMVRERLSRIANIITDVKIAYAESTERVQNRLRDRLAELASRYQTSVDDVRFEQELIYFLQKMDIAEEIDRLSGHLTACAALFSQDVPIGRKLDFLLQEMNRESNTIASKSQHLALSLNAVELKVLLEQIREQVQNIE